MDDVDESLYMREFMKRVYARVEGGLIRASEVDTIDQELVRDPTVVPPGLRKEIRLFEVTNRNVSFWRFW
jgi:hypothetical protein